VLITFSAGVTPNAIRVTQNLGVPSLAIIAMRLIVVTLTMTVYVFRRQNDAVHKLTRSDVMWSAAAGFWLAMNLLALFFALEYTSILVTGVLRRTTPIWVVGPEVLLLGAIFSWRIWGASLLAVVGVIAITVGTSGGVNPGTKPLLGALIALGGSMCFGIYLLIGRFVSTRMPSLVYSWLVFAFAGLVTLIAVAITQTPLTGYSANAYLWVVIVTVLAQYLGHIVLNIGLHYFSATAIAIILEMSVVVSGVTAFIQFGEVPSTLQIIGSGVIIVGVILASRERSNPPSVKIKGST